jgi:hypothetical protein
MRGIDDNSAVVDAQLLASSDDPDIDAIPCSRQTAKQGMNRL